MRLFLILFFLSVAAAAETSPWDFKISGGLFYDGNVAQSLVFNPVEGENPANPNAGSGSGKGSGHGGKNLLGNLNPVHPLDHGPGNNDAPSPAGPVGVTGSTLVDNGYVAESRLEYSLSDRWFLKASAEASFYKKYTSYDYEVYSGSVIYRDPHDDFSPSVELSYINTNYQSIYNQDYIRLAPRFRWTRQIPQWDWSFDFTKYTKTRQASYYVATTLEAKWRGETFDFAWGLTPSYGTGDKATYTSSGPLTDFSGGTQFSRYLRAATYVEASAHWSDFWEIIFTQSVEQTRYQKEDLPFDAGPGISHDPRVDMLSTTSLAVEYKISPDAWQASIAADSSHNQSSGFQGLLSGGQVPTAAYDRPYVLAKITYSGF